MKILLTGGSGFIGSAVMDCLRAEGFSAANYDLSPPIHRRHDRFWLQGDILDRARLSRCLEDVCPDAVIHLAAKADIFASAWADFASIHEGTANLLGALDDHGGVKRLANISTQLVIGPGYDPCSPLDFRPYSTYGEAKAYAEALLLGWETQAHWLTIRPANIWGPHHPSFAEAIWKYIRQRVYLHPAGEPVFRTYGYVDNVAHQIVALLKADPELTARSVFYGGDAVLDSAIWVDAFAVALTGRPARRMPKPLLKALGWAGDLVSYAGVKSPIGSARVLRMTQSYALPLHPTLALAGEPKVSLEEGVEASVAWLKASDARFA